jgi:hypothetical protein
MPQRRGYATGWFRQYFALLQRCSREVTRDTQATTIRLTTTMIFGAGEFIVQQKRERERVCARALAYPARHPVLCLRQNFQIWEWLQLNLHVLVLDVVLWIINMPIKNTSRIHVLCYFT